MTRVVIMFGYDMQGDSLRSSLRRMVHDRCIARWVDATGAVVPHGEREAVGSRAQEIREVVVEEGACLDEVLRLVVAARLFELEVDAVELWLTCTVGGGRPPPTGLPLSGTSSTAGKKKLAQGKKPIRLSPMADIVETLIVKFAANQAERLALLQRFQRSRDKSRRESVMARAQELSAVGDELMARIAEARAAEARK